MQNLFVFVIGDQPYGYRVSHTQGESRLQVELL